MSRAGLHTFVSCMPGECPKQLANMESLLRFSDVFAGILSQQKIASQLCWQNLLMARMCYFILGTSVLPGVAPPLRDLLI